MAKICFVLLSLVNVDGHPGHCSSLTFVGLWLVYFYTCCGTGFHIVLKTCIGFLLLVYIQPTTILSVCASFFGTYWKQSSYVDSVTIQLELTSQVWKYFAVAYVVHALTYIQNN
jgi:hypothetical protein